MNYNDDDTVFPQLLLLLIAISLSPHILVIGSYISLGLVSNVYKP